MSRRRAVVVSLLVSAALAACTNDYGAFQVESSGTGASGSGGSGNATQTGGAGNAIATGGGGAGASSSGGGGSGADGGSAGGGAGGTAGSGGGPVCGNGIIEAGEECDGGGDTTGCVSCAIDCAGTGEIHDPSTHHCYYRNRNDMGRTFDDSRTFCMNTWGGGDLLILETMAEYDFLRPYMPMNVTGMFFYVGATDLQTEGEWVWVNGLPVTFPEQQEPWMTNPAQPDGNGDCLVWRADSNPDAEGLGDVSCTGSNHPFCERPPPGM
jgi:hypothetical protein